MTDETKERRDALVELYGEICDDVGDISRRLKWPMEVVEQYLLVAELRLLRKELVEFRSDVRSDLVDVETAVDRVEDVVRNLEGV